MKVNSEVSKLARDLRECGVELPERRHYCKKVMGYDLIGTGKMFIYSIPNLYYIFLHPSPFDETNPGPYAATGLLFLGIYKGTNQVLSQMNLKDNVTQVAETNRALKNGSLINDDISNLDLGLDKISFS